MPGAAMETVMVSTLTRSTISMTTWDSAQHDITNLKQRTTEAHAGQYTYTANHIETAMSPDQEEQCRPHSTTLAEPRMHKAWV